MTSRARGRFHGKRPSEPRPEDPELDAGTGAEEGGLFSPAPSFKTRRRRLRDLLASRPDGFSLEEIQDIFDVNRTTALADLRHLQLSLRHAEDALLVVPPHCATCGYTFKLDEPHAPGKCPICKSDRVTDPVFKVGTAEA